MNYLVDARALQFHFSIVGIAYGRKGEDIMATAFWLKSQFSSRGSERLGDFTSSFIVALHAII